MNGIHTTRKYICLINTIILILLSIKMMGQADPLCGSEAYEELLLSDNVYFQQDQRLERRYQDQCGKILNSLRSNEVNIPVVVHIIHKGGAENISKNRIYKAIDHLNDGFSNAVPYHGGVDSKIKFCLAQRDEDGNRFDGITRHYSPYTDMSKQGSLKEIRDIVTYDRNRYLNIYIVKNACMGGSCDIAGFGGANTVFIEANYFGVDHITDGVLIHEVGHAFGLQHTWKGGCFNDNCLIDGDKVCDTPPDNRTFDGCTGYSNSCHTDGDDPSSQNPYRSIILGGLGDQPDDNGNFMDYNYKKCRHHFTQGQADRMYYFIQERYGGLSSSLSCHPPCVEQVAVDFTIPDTIDLASTLTILNTSQNADAFQWNIDGHDLGTSRDITYTFNELGKLRITLEGYIDDPACESISISKDVIVVCPIKACLTYEINGQYLVFESCTDEVSSIQWALRDHRGNTLYESMNTKDSLYINNIDYVELSIHVYNELCNDQYHTDITIVNNGNEVCGNHIDDDRDGLIDLFDPDCDCDSAAYQAQCPSECESISDTLPLIKMKMKWESVKLSRLKSIPPSNYILGNVDGDPYPEIFTHFGTGEYGNIKNYIARINANDGTLEDTIRVNPDYKSYEYNQKIALTRNPQNNEVLIYTKPNEVFCFGLDGKERFRVKHDYTWENLGVSDFNVDGIHEVYVKDVILNGETGNLLYKGDQVDCSTYGTCTATTSIAADVIGEDGIPELITGQYVYQLDIVNSTDSIGNNAKVIEAPEGVKNGHCAVADMDGDGLQEVIVVSGYNKTIAEDGYLSIWNPRNGALLAQVKSPISQENKDGSIPFLGDVNGDCIPEIGVVYYKKLFMYEYTNTSLNLLYSLNTSDESGRTGATMFDFNQDGNQELIYRDQSYLRIIEGYTGKTIDSTRVNSSSWREYPVITDVDEDGEAEIIISGIIDDRQEVRLYCFESATEPWAPARSVWNQYAYNPTQVNDDLTIPRYQQNAAHPLQGTEYCPKETCPTPYNNFMAQATYRTQEGCYIWPNRQQDFSISASSICLGDSIELCLHVTAFDTTSLQKGVPITIFRSPWNDTGSFIDSITVRNDSTYMMIPGDLDIDSMMIVINDHNLMYPPIFENETKECNYNNNEYIINLGGPDFTVDIIDYECTPDSLIFYIATDNIGKEIDVDCVKATYYFKSIDSSNPQINLAGTMSLCYEYNDLTNRYKYQDTFKISLLHPDINTRIYLTINDISKVSDNLYNLGECHFENNIDSLLFDISEKVLDLGPDIEKCETEVISLNAGDEFASYMWSDLSSDSQYSSTLAGDHYLEATDLCGRIYRDTVTFILKETPTIDLPEEVNVCEKHPVELSVSSMYEEVNWYSDNQVICTDCNKAIFSTDTTLFVYVQGRVDECITYDTIKLIGKEPTEYLETKSICAGDSLYYHDEWIKEANQYRKEVNCDSTVTLTLTVNSSYDKVVNHSACDSYTWNGTTHTESGIYPYATVSSQGCDSLITLHLTINDVLESTETVEECDRYYWNGETYTESGVYEQTFTSVQGCDSVAVLDLTLHRSILINESMQACDSVLWNGDWLHESGWYSKDTLTAKGCDSTIALLLTVHKSYDEVVNHSACDSYTWNGKTYTESGIYPYATVSSQGCDSLVTLDLTINDVLKSTETVEECDGYDWHGATYTESGVYEQTFTSVQGCDSIAVLDLTLHRSILINESMQACDSVLWNGTTYMESGIYSHEDQSITGCDSITRLDLTLHQAQNEVISMSSCEPIEWNGAFYDASGSYTYMTTTINGCDSTAVLDLIIEDDYHISETLEECDEVLWHGISYVESGIYLDTILTASGCDTIYTLDLQVTPSYAIADTIINQDDYLWPVNEATYSRSGIYQEVYESRYACDSIHYLYLTIEDIDKRTDVTYPNIIRPGGANGYFLLYPPESIVSLVIYDRWGTEVYVHRSGSLGWDGTSDGKPVTPGLYIWKATIKARDHSIVTKVGDVTVLR